MTELEVNVCLEHLEWRNRGGGPDLSMDGLVPAETQKRWAAKVAGAHHRMPDLQRKLQDAQDRAARAARDVAAMQKAARLKSEYERQKAEQANAPTAGGG